MTSTTPSPRARFSSTIPGFARAAGWLALVCVNAASAAEPVPSPVASPLPDVGTSLLRVFGALAVVLAVFLGGVWLFRNWQRIVIQRGRAPRLNVLEVRSLGGRHALYVIGYDHDRFLLAASPAGVQLLSHLPSAEEPAQDKPAAAQPTFAQALAQTLKGK
jgi:flagellar biogenesis protein FliO